MSSPISSVPYRDQNFEKEPGAFAVEESRQEAIDAKGDLLPEPADIEDELTEEEVQAEDEKEKNAETFIDAHPLS